MTSFQECEQNLQSLAQDESATNQERRNEATTRLQIIDRLLFDCLGWDRTNCIAEERYDDKYTDYSFYAPHRTLIVEAKREGIYFDVPAGQSATTRVSIKSFERHSAPVHTAIVQCMSYCHERGAPFGAVCNGDQLVAFLEMV